MATGAGKTTFLLNLPLYLGSGKSSELAGYFKVLDPIDPTLVDDCDHFILYPAGSCNAGGWAGY